MLLLVYLMVSLFILSLMLVVSNTMWGVLLFFFSFLMLASMLNFSYSLVFVFVYLGGFLVLFFYLVGLGDLKFKSWWSWLFVVIIFLFSSNVTFKFYGSLYCFSSVYSSYFLLMLFLILLSYLFYVLTETFQKMKSIRKM